MFCKHFWCIPSSHNQQIYNDSISQFTTTQLNVMHMLHVWASLENKEDKHPLICCWLGQSEYSCHATTQKWVHCLTDTRRALMTSLKIQAALGQNWNDKSSMLWPDKDNYGQPTYPHSWYLSPPHKVRESTAKSWIADCCFWGWSWSMDYGSILPRLPWTLHVWYHW